MRTKPTVETVEYLRMLRRMIRSAGTRVGHADPEDLALLIALGVDLDAAIVRAVAGLRTDGFTWQSIGEATGTTKEAAVQKWAHRVKPADGGGYAPA